MITPDFVLRILSLVATVLQWVIIINVLISWVPPLKNGKIGYFMEILSEPILSPVRRLLRRSPLGQANLDFSPVLAFLFIGVAQQLLSALIMWLWRAV
jgi:YggT family protein